MRVRRISRVAIRLVPGSLNTLYKFVPASNTWSTLAPFPGPPAIMTSAVYYPTTNKLYVFGGEDGDSGDELQHDPHL